MCLAHIRVVSPCKCTNYRIMIFEWSTPWIDWGLRTTHITMNERKPSWAILEISNPHVSMIIRRRKKANSRQQPRKRNLKSASRVTSQHLKSAKKSWRVVLSRWAVTNARQKRRTERNIVAGILKSKHLFRKKWTNPYVKKVLKVLICLWTYTPIHSILYE